MQTVFLVFSKNSLLIHISATKRVSRAFTKEKQNNTKKRVTLYKLKKSAFSDNIHFYRNLHSRKKRTIPTYSITHLQNITRQINKEIQQKQNPCTNSATDTIFLHFINLQKMPFFPSTFLPKSKYAILQGGNLSFCQK